MELTNFYIPGKSRFFFLKESFEFEHHKSSIDEDDSEEKDEFETPYGLIVWAYSNPNYVQLLLEFGINKMTNMDIINKYSQPYDPKTIFKGLNDF